MADELITTPTDTPRQTRSPSRVIPTRRISFESSLREVPKHFAADGDLINSHLAVCLSGVFPDGEDFFVRSVRHYRDQITDPDLRRQVSGFIGQESVHGREHRALNDRFAELGYGSKRLERMAKRGLALRERIMSPQSNLAATAALEHFTATLAELLMTDERAPQLLGHEAVRNVFMWHALEESEHKAVAFDVYRAIGGSERLRVNTMRLTRLSFVIGLAFQIVVSLITDRATYQPRRLRKSLREFRRNPLISKAVWQQLCEYDAPTFHPDDHDTEALVEHWKGVLFGDHGTLTPLLASPGRDMAAAHTPEAA